MNIANKIASLVALLLIGMAINNIVGLQQLGAVKDELNRVTQQDMLLTESIMRLNQKQLKKAVLFERLLRIAEELAFERVSSARRLHLNDHLSVTKQGFDQLAQEGAIAIIDAGEVIRTALTHSTDFMLIEALQKASHHLDTIEEAHITYDQNVSQIVEHVFEEKEISFEDLSQLRREEKKLTREMEDLLTQVQGLTRISIETAQTAQNVAKRILLYSLYISIFLGAVIAFLIIRGIARPLGELVEATHQIGSGNLRTRVEKRSEDEIGQLGESFNLMTEQLFAAKNELEEKNTALSEALDLTNQQKKDLEKVNRELDNFVATISHDIRAPLTGISGYGTILERQYYDQLDKRGKRSIDGIRQGADRMNAMLHDLLELTKMSRSRQPYSLVDINDVIDEICDRLDYRIEQNNARIHVCDDLPEITCDKIKLGIVFFNLLNNAVKFRKENQDPDIYIDYAFQNGRHEFTVKDNGIGIPREDQEDIFLMFKRSSTAQAYEGTGAGLSFVKEIVQEHGGEIWVVSEDGKGSAFYFTIAADLI